MMTGGLAGPFVEATQDWESCEARLSEVGKVQVEAIREVAVQVRAEVILAQATRYPQDLADARQQVIEGKPSPDYRPRGVRTPISRAEVERRAEGIVDRQNVREVKAVEQVRDAAIRKVFVAEGLVPEQAQEKGRSSWRAHAGNLRRDFDKER